MNVRIFSISLFCALQGQISCSDDNKQDQKIVAFFTKSTITESQGIVTLNTDGFHATRSVGVDPAVNALFTGIWSQYLRRNKLSGLTFADGVNKTRELMPIDTFKNFLAQVDPIIKKYPGLAQKSGINYLDGTMRKTNKLEPAEFAMCLWAEGEMLFEAMENNTSLFKIFIPTHNRTHRRTCSRASPPSRVMSLILHGLYGRFLDIETLKKLSNDARNKALENPQRKEYLVETFKKFGQIDPAFTKGDDYQAVMGVSDEIMPHTRNDNNDDDSEDRGESIALDPYISVNEKNKKYSENRLMLEKPESPKEMAKMIWEEGEFSIEKKEKKIIFKLKMPFKNDPYMRVCTEKNSSSCVLSAILFNLYCRKYSSFTKMQALNLLAQALDAVLKEKKHGNRIKKMVEAAVAVDHSFKNSIYYVKIMRLTSSKDLPSESGGKKRPIHVGEYSDPKVFVDHDLMTKRRKKDESKRQNEQAEKHENSASEDLSDPSSEKVEGYESGEDYSFRSHDSDDL